MTIPLHYPRPGRNGTRWVVPGRNVSDSSVRSRLPVGQRTGQPRTERARHNTHTQMTHYARPATGPGAKGAAYVLARMCMMSPSMTRYVFPSSR